MNPKNFPPLKPLFLERMKKLLSSSDLERYKKALNFYPPASIRCNALKISPEELKKRLESKRWKIKQPWKNYPEVIIIEGKYVRPCSQISDSKLTSSSFSFNQKQLIENIYKNTERLNTTQQKTANFTLTNPKKSASVSEPNLQDLEPGELGRALEHLLGYYYVQDLASMLSVIALKPKPNETILDLCAAPGSKTTQIASAMKNTGTIIANDVSFSRIKILASNLERCGVTNTIITKKEGVALCEKLKKENFFFDRILIDAPCSGEGTLRSSPKTALMWNPQTIKSLSRIQKKLINSALEILKPNGILVYSTCTHAPEENEEVVDFILENFKDKVKMEEIKLPIKCRKGITSWNPGLINKINKSSERSELTRYNKEIKKSCRIYPHDADTEGFFVARLRKVE